MRVVIALHEPGGYDMATGNSTSENKFFTNTSIYYLGLLLLSLFLHAVIIASIPREAFAPDRSGLRNNQSEARVTYKPKPKKPESPEKPPQYIEANPNVPENKPDETPFESARDQQAAQKKPEPDSDALKPTVDGEHEDSPKVVDGNQETVSSQPVPPGVYSMNNSRASPSQQQSNASQSPAPEAPPAPEQTTSPDSAQAKGEKKEEAASPKEGEAKKPQPAPLPEFLRKQPEKTKDGKDTVYQEKETKESQQVPREGPRVIQLQRDGKTETVEVRREQVQNTSSQNPSSSGQPKPRPRPKLRINVPSGPVMKNPASASRTGMVAVESKYSEFGDYMQRISEAVSEQWHALASRSDIGHENTGTYVEIRFEIDDKGYIYELEVVHSSAGLLATNICEDAIRSRAPYDEWPKSMKKRIGERMPMRFSFHYR